MMKVGDFVKVIWPGHCYSRYEGWVEKYGFTSRWANGVCPERGAIGEIIFIAPHSSNKGEVLYAVDINDWVYVMGFNGINHAKNMNYCKKMLGDDLFKI
jgi:hypothetical protein